MNEFEESIETASRYVVGIDLGTTNSAVAYVDTTAASALASLRRLPCRSLSRRAWSKPAKRCRRSIISGARANSRPGALRLALDQARSRIMPSACSPAIKGRSCRAG